MDNLEQKKLISKISYDMVLFDIRNKIQGKMLHDDTFDKSHRCGDNECYHMTTTGFKILHVCNICNNIVCKNCDNLNSYKNEHAQCRQIINNIIKILDEL
jgi:hypothetical protein